MANFQNNTGRDVKVRLEKRTNRAGYVWLTVKEGSNVDLPLVVGRNFGFDLVNTVKEAELIVEDNEAFAEELLSIKGVGKRVAAEIIGLYGDRSSLLVAVEGGEEIPFSKTVVSALKKHFEE